MAGTIAEAVPGRKDGCRRANGLAWSEAGSLRANVERRVRPSAVPAFEDDVAQEGVSGHLSTLLQEQAEGEVGDPPAGTRQAQERPLCHAFGHGPRSPPHPRFHSGIIAVGSRRDKASPVRGVLPGHSDISATPHCTTSAKGFKQEGRGAESVLTSHSVPDAVPINDDEFHKASGWPHRSDHFSFCPSSLHFRVLKRGRSGGARESGAAESHLEIDQKSDG
jgi:hypothetical protein